MVDPEQPSRNWRRRRFLEFTPALGGAVLTSGLGVATNLAVSQEHGRFGLWAVVILTAAGAVVGYLSRRPTADHVRLIVIGLVVAGALIVAPVVVVNLSGPSCPHTCFDFEDGAAGWGVRWDGDVLLGQNAAITELTDDGGWLDHHALALSFRLRTKPAERAQVKVEQTTLEQQLAASVFVPQGLPSSLVVSAFVLEHNDPQDTLRPEWVFYQTQPSPLQAGQWVRVQFARNMFGIVGYSPAATWPQTPVGVFWRGMPLLVGLQIHDSVGGQVDGTVYFDEISVA